MVLSRSSPFRISADIGIYIGSLQEIPIIHQSQWQWFLDTVNWQEHGQLHEIITNVFSFACKWVGQQEEAISEQIPTANIQTQVNDVEIHVFFAFAVENIFHIYMYKTNCSTQNFLKWLKNTGHLLQSH